MTALALMCMLVAAMSIGYRVGRRADSTPSTWKNQTRRTALGARALGLIGWMLARRVQRSVQKNLRKLKRACGWHSQVVSGRCPRPIGLLVAACLGESPWRR
ncbi:MAG: hypothetical protein JO280_05825 [Mycobacteriaceae bacterium]|nr:hypothetical protein [Mycobacteriaceae bacterium]